MRNTLLLCFLAILAACGGEAPPAPPAPDAPAATGATEAPPSPQDALTDAMDQFQEAFGDVTPRATAPVDFRDLRALVPEDAAGLSRTDIEGATEGAMGLSVSRVEATFSDGADANADVSIVDLGMFPQLSMFGVGWTALTIDRESSDGYERTTRFEGYPAFEQASTTRAELQVVVGNRFLVSAEGTASMATLQDLVRAHDLAALEALRGTNVES